MPVLQTAGEKGDFAAYRRVLLVAQLLFVRSNNVNYFPLVRAHEHIYMSCIS